MDEAPISSRVSYSLVNDSKVRSTQVAEEVVVSCKSEVVGGGLNGGVYTGCRGAVYNSQSESEPFSVSYQAVSSCLFLIGCRQQL